MPGHLERLSAGFVIMLHVGEPSSAIFFAIQSSLKEKEEEEVGGEGGGVFLRVLEPLCQGWSL